MGNMDRKEAIEKIKKMNLPIETMELLEALAPELAESEDERIRKEMLKHFNDALVSHQEVTTSEQVKSWIAYLEKQKEPHYTKHNALFDECVAKCDSATMKEVSDNVDKIQKESLHIKESCKENGNSLTDEDERIRSGLIRYLESDRDYQPCQDISFYEEAIAWLEKQKEHKPVSNPKWNELTWKDINELERIINNVHHEFRNGIGEESFGKEILERFRDTKDDTEVDACEQKPADLSEMMVHKEPYIAPVPTPMIADEQKPVDYAEELKKCKDNPLYFYDKYVSIKQKPAEWSEEDEEVINGCIHAIEYELIDNGQDEQVVTDPRIAFLKSLKPHLKQEWSETNELVLKDICNHLKEEGYGGWVLFLQALRNGEFNFQPKQEWSEEDNKMLVRLLESISIENDYEEMRNWLLPKLKSLKPQDSNNISITSERLKELRDRSFEDGRKAGMAEMAKSMPLPEDTVLFQKGVKEGRRLEREDMWKPSEEQMDALIYAMQVMNTDLSPIAARTYQGLQEIHQNLKKL